MTLTTTMTVTTTMTKLSRAREWSLSRARHTPHPTHRKLLKLRTCEGCEGFNDPTGGIEINPAGRPAQPKESTMETQQGNGSTSARTLSREERADYEEAPILEALRACASGEFASWTPEQHEHLLEWTTKYPAAIAHAACTFLDECRLCIECYQCGGSGTHDEGDPPWHTCIGPCNVCDGSGKVPPGTKWGG